MAGEGGDRAWGWGLGAGPGERETGIGDNYQHARHARAMGASPLHGHTLTLLQGPHIWSPAHSGTSHANACTLGAFVHSLSCSGDRAATEDFSLPIWTSQEPASALRAGPAEQVPEVTQHDREGVELRAVRGQGGVRDGFAVS